MIDYKFLFAYNDIKYVQHCIYDKEYENYEFDSWEGSEEDIEKLQEQLSLSFFSRNDEYNIVEISQSLAINLEKKMKCSQLKPMCIH